MFLVLSASASSALAAEVDASALPLFPNIGYLGSGYNVMLGNPHALGENDPGFVSSIYDMGHYGTNKTTEDRRYRIPDHTEVKVCQTCYLTWDTTEVYGTHSYFDSLQVDVSVDFKGWGAAFSGSSSYHNVQQGTENSSYVFTSSTAACTVYCGLVEAFTTPQFTDNFDQAVRNYLPANYSESKYMYFLSQFGTHLVSEVKMGGRFGQLSKVSSSNWTKMIDTGLNIKTAASYAAMGVSASASVMTDQQKRDAQTFSRYTSHQSLFTVGGLPPSDGKVETWAQNSIKEPMPLHYILQPIETLLTASHFPKESHIAAKQSNLKKAVTEYCSYLLAKKVVKSCSAPGPDPRPYVPTGCSLCADACGGAFPIESGAFSLDQHWPNWFLNQQAGCVGEFGAHNYGQGVKLCCKSQSQSSSLPALSPPPRSEPQEAVLATPNPLAAQAGLVLPPADNVSSEAGGEACRICNTCGGNWPTESGGISMDQDWSGFFNFYQQNCDGAYRSGHYPGGLRLCCQKKPACTFCTTCGGDYRYEKGSFSHDKNWPSFFTDRGDQCTGDLSHHDYNMKDGIKLCCHSP